MLDHNGTLKIYMYVLESNDNSDDVFKGRTRRVTLLTRHCIKQGEASELAARFLKDNALDDERKHPIEAVWTFSSLLFQE